MILSYELNNFICSLLVTDRRDVDTWLEFEHILNWTGDNKLSINMTKTEEIVSQRPCPRNDLRIAAIPDIERVVIAKLLGVWLQPDLGTRH